MTIVTDAGRLAIALLLCIGLPRAAGAHAVGLSRSTWTLDGQHASARLTFARGDAETLLAAGELRGRPEGPAPSIATLKLVFEGVLRDGLLLSAAGTPCVGGLRAARFVEADGLEIDAEWNCPDGAADLEVELAFLQRLPLGHRHLAQIGSGREDLVVAQAQSARILVPAGASSKTSATAAAVSILRLGIEHVLCGWDHLLFLFGLVLAASRLRSLVVAATAFTVGHSLSLAIATLVGWSPPTWLVEPAFAASIAWIGIENLRAGKASSRWWLTLPFGLVHGFGFAGALQEIDLPSGQVPLALVSFNVGVELAQLMAIALLLPLVMYCRSPQRMGPRFVRMASLAIILVGAFTCVLRVATMVPYFSASEAVESAHENLRVGRHGGSHGHRPS